MAQYIHLLDEDAREALAEAIIDEKKLDRFMERFDRGLRRDISDTIKNFMFGVAKEHADARKESITAIVTNGIKEALEHATFEEKAFLLSLTLLSGPRPILTRRNSRAPARCWSDWGATKGAPRTTHYG